MDKLTALRVFRRVAELESFSAAATDLNLSNAAVSKNVRELEAELGARLINRTTRRLHLTEAGQLYLARTCAILDDLKEADSTISELSATPRGHLKVSAPMSLGLTKIAPAVASFLIDHPGIKVDLELNDRYVDIVDGGFDVAIRGGAQLDDSSLIARKLCNLERVACASPLYLARKGGVKAPTDLPDHDCLVYTLATAPSLWTFKRGNDVQAIEVSGSLKVNNSLAIAAAATAGLGIALAPTFAVERELASGMLKRVLPRWVISPGAIYAVYPRHRQASLKVRAFIDTIARLLT